MKNSSEETRDLLLQAVDRNSITELIYRYCRAVDRLDVPLGHSIWHDDGIADYGELYRGPGKGVIDLICEQHLALLHHSHQVANILITLAGDTAGSESYVHATLRAGTGDNLQQIDVWARYIDQWSKRDGRWGLDLRTVVIDFDEVRGVTEMQRHHMGKRDRSDPSYNALAPSE